MLLPTREMNANTIKAAAKPLGMLAVRCPASCVCSNICPRIEREKRRVVYA